MGFRTFARLTDPWWEQQPGESPTHYARFAVYRDMPPGDRSLRKVLERVTKKVTYNSLKNQAYSHRWRDRVAAFDRHQSEQHYQRVADRAERLAEVKLATASDIITAVRHSVQYVLDNDIILEPEQAAKWADAAVKLAKAASEAPSHVMRMTASVEHTGAGSHASVEIEVPELAGLSPEEARERLTEMVSGVARLEDYRQRQARRELGA